MRWLSCTHVPPTSTGTSTTTPASANVSLPGNKSGPGSLNCLEAGSLVAPPALTFIVSAGGRNPAAGCAINVPGSASGQRWPWLICTPGLTGQHKQAYQRGAWFMHLIRMMRGMARDGCET